VAVLGGGLGCLLGVVLHLAGVETLGDLVGFDVHFAVDPFSLVFAVAACAAVTVGGALFPARSAGRLRVSEAVGYE
jgi:ABC-type antimicrobial peptide transport system permease subunit